MKKAIFAAAVLVLSYSSVFAADIGKIETLRSQGLVSEGILKVEAPVPAAPAKADTADVPQDLINKFQQTARDLRILGNSAWVYIDLDRLESDARQIGQGVSMPFFESDLRNMSLKMSGWADDARRISSDVKNLLTLAQKSAELNRSANDISSSARDLLNNFQFQVQNSADRLEWTVKGVNPGLIGYDAQWTAMDISRNSRDIQWAARNLSFDAKTLVDNTQP